MISKVIGLIEKESRKLHFLAFESEVLKDTAPIGRQWVEVKLDVAESTLPRTEQPMYDSKGYCNYKIDESGEIVLRSAEEKAKDKTQDDALQTGASPSELAIAELATIAATQELAITELSIIIGGLF